MSVRAETLGVDPKDFWPQGEEISFDLSWIGKSTGRAERRQVVVLAVGFERVANSDPEVIVEVLADRRNFVAQIVARYGGTVGRVDPDLQIVAWGWPIAAEADTRLAVSAALEIAASIDHGACCGVDAGIAVTAEVADPFAGLGFVGEMVAGAIAQQATASTGQVLVSEAVRFLVGDAFELARDDTPAAPNSLWLVRRRLATDRRRQLAPSLPIELVGREIETTELEGNWRRVVAGNATIVAIEGEAGIGKSALLHWLEHRVGDERSASVEINCLPENRHLALEPARILVDMLGRLDEPLLARNESCGAVTGPDPCLGDVDGATVTERCRTLLRQPEVDVVLLGAEILRLARYKAAVRPLLISIEDLQWADDATLRLIAGLRVEDGCSGRILIVLTQRSGPGHQPLPADAQAWRRIRLGRLSTRHIEKILEANEHAAAIGEEQRKRIVSMADGNPFHARELARIVVAAETASPYRRLLAGPNRLNPGLAERLDALASLKPLAQAAAVLGRLLDARVLAAALGMDTKVVRERLELLVTMGILVRSRSERINQFRFHDALLWTQAYGSVLRSRRHAFHLKIASVLDGPLG